MVGKHTQRFLLAVVCCSVLVLLPFSSAWAQNDLLEGTKEGIQKGAEGAKKGAETVGEKTKEGAEAVGEGAKDLFTDDDQDTDKDETTTDRMKPGETKPGTTKSDTEAQSGQTESSASSSAEERELPRTAGELPLLAIVGAMALISAGTLRVVRKAPKD
jgi:hypothetical protein